MLSMKLDMEHTAPISYGIIDLLQSAHLKSYLYRENTKTIFYVCEIGYSPDIADIMSSPEIISTRFFHEVNFDGVLFVFDNDSKIFNFARTYHSNTPLYLTFCNNILTLSWDFLKVASAIENPRPNIDICRSYIVNGPRLYRETIIRNVYLLLGGEAVVIVDNLLEFRKKSIICEYETTNLVPEADVSGAFLDLIKSYVQIRAKQSKNLAVEISGGKDSACVAGAVSRIQNIKKNSYGLIHSGIAGVQQVIRRNEMIKNMGFKDKIIHSNTIKPFYDLLHAKNLCITPFDEIYRTGIEACIDTFEENPLDLVITGIGGDELTYVNQSNSLPESEIIDPIEIELFEYKTKTQDEIKSLAISSVTAAALCRADMFLRRNVWPCNPFSSPDIITFSQLLPHSLKNGRLLNIITLAKMGMSEYFVFPRYKENFRRVYEDDLNNFCIDDLLEDGIVQSLGIAKTNVISKNYTDYINTGQCKMSIIVFMNALRLEIMLRRFI